MKDWKAYCGFLCLILPVIVIFAFLIVAGNQPDRNNTFAKTMGIGFIVFSIGIGLIGSSVNDDKKRIRKELGIFPQFNQETGELKIFQRTPALAHTLYVKDDKNFSTRTTPVKTHVGAVTVGGVTTGGVYTTGGDRVIDNTWKTGRCRLYFTNSYYRREEDIVDGLIKKIIITSQIYEGTNDDYIKGLMCKFDAQGNYYIPVITKTNISVEQFSSVAADPFSVNSQELAKRGLPTREKCEKIVRWLCSNE